MPKKKLSRSEREIQPITMVNRLGTIVNTAAAADLFATMLRSVEIERQRAEENANGRTGAKTTEHH
jgi:hypothetical protein